MQIIDIGALLRRKNLHDKIFDLKNDSLFFEAPLHQHIQWVFNNIYSYPYPNKAKRLYHGIQHVSRVALYVPIWANLYRKHGDDEAIKLTKEDIHLLQIAALFHDSARENEGTDYWDHESAILLYYYLTRILQLDQKKAKLITEAIANKDFKKDQYFVIEENSAGEVRWQYEVCPDEKNIYQKIIHDADCLDIIRARPHFDAKYLDFYQYKVKNKNNNLALEEMAHLICEARGLIHIQGDAYMLMQFELKERYEHKKAYASVINDINKNEHKIINILHKDLFSPQELSEKKLVNLQPYRESKGLTKKNMQSALREGRIFARGIATPSAMSKKNDKESLAQLEIRKTMREQGIPTKSTKPNNIEKKENPLRAVSMINYGSSVFTNAGFVIVNPTLEAIAKVSEVDCDSGRGKKTKIMHLKDKKKRHSETTIAKKLANLKQQLKLGGKSRIFDRGYPSSHVEILYDISHYDGIYFSNDPNLYNHLVTGSPEETHKNSPILQAVFLQKQYEIQYEKMKKKYIKAFGALGREKFIARFGPNKTLPIFEYSGIHNKIVPHGELSEEQIFQLWMEMIEHFLRKNLLRINTSDLLDGNLPIEDIKILSMYGVKENPWAKENVSADTNYSPELRLQIDGAIKEILEKDIPNFRQTIRHLIQNNEKKALSNEVFLYLLRSPSLRNELYVQLMCEINKTLNSDNLFSEKPLMSFFGQIENSLLSVTTDWKQNLSIFVQEKINIQHKIFSTPAMKIYFLAHLLEFKKPIDILQKQATKLVEQTLFEISKEKISKYSILNIFNLCKFIDVFNIQTEVFESQIAKLIQQTVLNEILHFIKENETKDLKFLVSNLKNSGFLLPKYQPIINQCLTEVKNWLIQNLDKAHLIQYLNIACSFKVEATEIKKTLIECFHKKDFNLAGLDLVKMISKYISINDSHLDLFTHLIKQSSLRPFSSGEHALHSNILLWVKMMKDWQDLVANKRYSPKQLKIIEKKWTEEVCEQYLVSLRIHWNLPNFIEYMNLLLDIGLPLPMKKFINLLNDKIKNLDNPLNEQMMSSLKTTQQRLQEHEQLLEEKNKKQKLYNPKFYQAKFLSEEGWKPTILQWQSH
ncbi:MAG: HD domain-containing protein [Legionella longbeachae]|nr:HD domain-containing protein [Legionella longbeachae]